MITCLSYPGGRVLVASGESAASAAMYSVSRVNTIRAVRSTKSIDRIVGCSRRWWRGMGKRRRYLANETLEACGRVGSIPYLSAMEPAYRVSKKRNYKLRTVVA